MGFDFAEYLSGTSNLKWIYKAGKFIKYTYKHGKNKFLSHVIYRNQEIRVSISYIFRINYRDNYLLIKGNRFDQFQPIGGVYKYYSDSKEFFESLEIRKDTNVPLDNVSEDDLRIKVKGKYLDDLIKWYCSRKNREISCHRELKEELFENDSEILSQIKYRYLKTVVDGIRLSSYYNCQEFLIYDVMELILLESDRENIERITNKNPDKYRWVSTKDIEGLHIQESGITKHIGKHTKYIL